MRLFVFIATLLCSLACTSQNLYDLNTIQRIDIDFAESNWDQLLDSEYAGAGGYILARSVSINGEVFDSVGVKYKGNSTYSANQAKNPFHIELDTYKDHIYQEYTDIKLSNVAKDPSFLREVLSYQILRQYMDAPLSNFANVYVNGDLIGLYSNSESISKKFVNTRFLSKDNAFIKCNPPEGAGPNSNDFPNLVYLGQDSTDYYDAYELKSDHGWQELIDLCDTLANHLEDIEKILDVDRALWMLAYNNVLVNLDSYSGGFTQNYYLYKDDYGRFLPVIWDLNESFGGFAMTGSGNLNNTAAKRNMDHLLHLNDSDFPLISRLLSVPSYRRMYIAHMKTIVQENFDNDSYFTSAMTLQELIADHVQADNNKFYTHNNFISNLTSDISSGGGPGGGGGGGSVPGITSLMDGRASYLLGLADFTSSAPTVSDVQSSSDDPIIGETVSISALVVGASDVTLAVRASTGAPFTKITMNDNGVFGDITAGDNIYTAEIESVAVLSEYYIYAENQDAGSFSPSRAQHEFYTLEASFAVGDINGLVINELMASNDITIADQDGEFDDWVELYNNGTSAIDLAGYFLSDDDSNPGKWEFPADANIGPGQYLIIWADEDGGQDGLHANFKLSAGGEVLILSDPDTMIVDAITFDEQTTDVSYGRYPNGTGDFRFMGPTFNAENVMTVAVSDQTSLAQVSMFPNPAHAQITIIANSVIDEVQLRDLEGRLILSKEGTSKSTTLNLGDLLASGLYVVITQLADSRVVVSRIVID